MEKTKFVILCQKRMLHIIDSPVERNMKSAHLAQQARSSSTTDHMTAATRTTIIIIECNRTALIVALKLHFLSKPKTENLSH